MYTIYAHKNKINGKYYVGQTIQDLNKRWQPTAYQACTKFYRAIQKYGWNNFEHIILEECETEEQANIREDYWICFFDSIANGYNILRGGRVYQNSEKIASVNGRKVICLNTKKIYNSISEAERDTQASHIANCCMGKIQSSGQDAQGNKLYWKYLEDYTGTEQIAVEKHMRPKSAVRCLNTNIVYDSAREASRATHVDNGSINKVINGNRRTAGKDPETGLGLVWILENEQDSEISKKNIQYYQQMMIKYNESKDIGYKCTETGETFKTEKEAAKYAGITLSNAYLIRYCAEHIKNNGANVNTVGKHPITREPLHWEKVKI